MSDAPSSAGDAPHAPAPGAQWARLHPLTPVLKGWRALAAVAAISAQDGLRRGGFSGLQLAITVAVVLPLAAIGGVLSWLRRRWRVEGNDLRLDYGVITRKSRRVPLARLQAVDVVRPLLARALGLAELRLEVVGHGGTEATLAYLTEAQALHTRAHLLDLAHRVPSDNQPAALEPRAATAPSGPDPPATLAPPPADVTPPEAAPTWGPHDEAHLITVPTGRFLASLILSASGAIALIIIAAVLLAVLVTPAAAGAVAAALLPMGATLYRKFTIEFGFTVSLSPQGLRLRHGLLDTRHQTVPRGRVQALRVVEPWLWRHFGWVRVEVDVAGYRSRGAAAAEERTASGVLVPVAPRSDAESLIQVVLPGLDLQTLPLARPPRRALWRTPLSWHYLGAATNAGFSLTSYGRIRRVTDVVPHDKLQSVRLVAGPLQRKLRLATVHLDTAGRNVHAALWQWDAAAAADVLAHLAALARTARSQQP